MNGANSALKARSGPATIRATASGREIAQFLGTSSPTTISTTVDTPTPSADATPGTTVPGSPAAVSGPRNSAARDGSASMPMTREVTVMPSWAPDNWKASARTALSTPSAPRSPSSTARSTALRSTVVSENSAATNTAQASVSANAAKRSNTSATASPPAAPRCPAVGG